MARDGGRHADQGAVWNEIGRKARAMGVSSPTAAMHDIFEGHRAHVEDYAGAVNAVMGQLGAVFAIGNRVAGLELFDAEETCRQYLPRLVRSFALDALEHASGSRLGAGKQVNPEALAQALEELLAADTHSYASIGIGEDLRMSGERMKGAALIRDGMVVHLTAFWNDSDSSRPRRSERNSMPRNREALERLAREGGTEARMGAWLDEPPQALAPDADRIWDRVEGMLLGLAIGDALGNTSEGRLPALRELHHGTIRDYLPNRHALGMRVGLPSDDTQLAFWSLVQLLHDGELVPERLARRFTQGRILGIGSTVRAFLRDHKDARRPWHESGQRSAGNGALMRIAPVLVPHVSRPSAALWSDAAIAGLVTHNDAASMGACVGFVKALWGAISMTELPEPGWWTRTVCETMRQVEGETRYRSRVPHLEYEGPMWRFTEMQVTSALDAGLSAREACNRWYSGAYLLETLPSVLYILECHARDPEEAIVRAVNDTWDNDTVAAIVGAAVGALHGSSALPRRWVAGLLGRTAADDDGHVHRLLAEARRRWGPGSVRTA